MTCGDLINSGFEEEFNSAANLYIQNNEIYGDNGWPLCKYDGYDIQQTPTDVIDYNGYYHWYD